MRHLLTLKWWLILELPELVSRAWGRAVCCVVGHSKKRERHLWEDLCARCRRVVEQREQTKLSIVATPDWQALDASARAKHRDLYGPGAVRRARQEFLFEPDADGPMDAPPDEAPLAREFDARRAQPISIRWGTLS